MRTVAPLVFLIFGVICPRAGTQASADAHPFADPEIIYSHAGKLHVDLVAAPAGYTIEGHQFQGMLYNAQYMPPFGICAHATC